MSAETIARLHIVLNDIEPAIWRQVDVPVTASLKMLHDIIQAAMGWENYHLWHFEAGDRRYGVPDPAWPDHGMAAARNVKLAALLDRGVRELLYTYDMGDDWRHTITIESIGPGEPDQQYPRFVDGERRCPPEDVGGLPGFEMFLDAMADPSHEEHHRLREWYGGPYNPDDIDERFTRRALAAIANRRHAGKIAYLKSRAQ
ncbi:plasmid pRiA4b ORF-3 family protein [Sphingomonas pokkalii]|uniref:Plasmid pRiA4b ORF-3 family protein n=1 Tax=Sphingomonas pokkalii TaxID=2175090 RepID=A0A2U0SC07_9SPHN|nr:plasmid pRiA4b ORF-3 family protein [Sphingomonas pokkalii]PVX28906.1 plasmid pRiA4b ORF-3 family protein [Sphingomonas pokkalii]